MVLEKKSYAKVNIFLKIVGIRDNYHLLASRFARVHSLYDTISFIKQKSDEFTLEGNFSCTVYENTIYKAYLKLCQISPRVQFYFKNHRVEVNKKIPEFAGLGGGSSNCATFMLMVNEVCNLKLSLEQLSKIALSIGADVPFFIYEYDSANVSGIGEIVEEFKEEILDIKTITPKVQCNTGEIFKQFRDKFYKEISSDKVEELFSLKSKDILNKLNINEANDLYAPASSLYEELEIKNMNFDKTHHFSGSGSSFFYIN